MFQKQHIQAFRLQRTQVLRAAVHHQLIRAAELVAHMDAQPAEHTVLAGCTELPAQPPDIPAPGDKQKAAPL